VGKHKDPDALHFIDWLSQKGESLGFLVKKEYELLKGEYFVDLVWKLDEKQDPLVTFEIETKDHQGVFSNTEKIFGPPSKMVLKPWRHFMIIYKDKLSKGHKTALFSKLTAHNISLFENVFHEVKKKEKLERDLENITYDISALITNVIRGKSWGESLPLILKGLAMGLGADVFKDPKVSISVHSNISKEGGLNFKIRTQTQKGQPLFLDKLKETQRTLKPFTIEAPELQDVVIEGKSALPKDKGKAKITIVPTPKQVPVTIVIPNTTIAFENVMLRLVKREDGTDHLSTEERNLPFVFELALNQKQNSGNYNFRFEPSHGDVEQALQFEEFIKALNEQKEVKIIDPKENKMVMGFNVHNSVKQNSAWYELISKLSYIQERTKHTIPAPIQITREEARKTQFLIRIMNTGKENVTIDDVSFRIERNAAKNMVATQEKEGKISNLGISQPETFRPLFNEKIPLGPSKITLPDMKFMQPLEEVKKQIENTPEGTTIKLTLVPVADKSVEIIFENWLAGVQT
jgi:hypothetical protein